MNLKEKAKQLKTDIPAVFIALKKKETPIIAKIFAAFGILYVLSPIDFIPDFIPILGQLDDFIIVPFFIALAIRFIPKEIFADCRKQAEGLWANGKPKKWYYALPFIFVWIIVVFLIVKLIYKNKNI